MEKYSFFLYAALLLSGCSSTQPFFNEGLVYPGGSKTYVPIAPSEKNLSNVVAEPYFEVSKETLALESPVFDKQGNLYFVSVYEGRIYKLTPERNISVFYEEKGFFPGGIAITKDGDFVAANVGDFKSGTVTLIGNNGKKIRDLLSAKENLVPDDLVIDKYGGIYFTDFRGSSTDLQGGIYYLNPVDGGFKPLLKNMSAPNGIALSPNGKVLWATEFGNSRLHRIELGEPGKIGRYGSSIPYHFVGKGPDSMRTDVDGNVYVVMYGQGRIMVFDSEGLPIGQILLPGRTDGKFLKVASLIIDHQSRDMYIVARDELKKHGSWIFKSKAFAQGTRLYSHQ
ncbi:SMP-30/gluconolactonase/LRE family protein [Comamonas sp. Y33R10-2]|uniref:SMP-30/gluconolactonase/LRE family protein n=1 Tax=Comamonas sp. Y33R10-2 TaxID=2853257 RepID=UPI001C5CB392|nr:SMP-30/gluconolactonase/LRE family protein [Comamonas sp. Y33R10-2]QXZ10712.1 SMP-30/gluconolactonase/LRE family protein [Comamonas sp. Y33R10-2]